MSLCKMDCSLRLSHLRVTPAEEGTLALIKSERATAKMSSKLN